MRFTLNGSVVSTDVVGTRRLLDVLREDLHLTGTKEGCGEGECGACSVLIDGEVVDSCLVAVGQVEGRTVTTVEGLADGGRLTAFRLCLGLFRRRRNRWLRLLIADRVIEIFQQTADARRIASEIERAVEQLRYWVDRGDIRSEKKSDPRHEKCMANGATSDQCF